MTGPEARPADRKRRNSANLADGVDGGHGSCPPRGHQRRATGGCARPCPWDDDLTGPRGQPLAWGPYPPGHRSRPGEAGQPPWRGAPMWCVKRQRVARPGPLSVTSILCLVPPRRRSRSRAVDLVREPLISFPQRTRSTYGERDQPAGNEINRLSTRSTRRAPSPVAGAGIARPAGAGRTARAGARARARGARGRGHPGGHDPWQSPGARGVLTRPSSASASSLAVPRREKCPRRGHDRPGGSTCRQETVQFRQSRRRCRRWSRLMSAAWAPHLTATFTNMFYFIASDIASLPIGQ